MKVNIEIIQDVDDRGRRFIDLSLFNDKYTSKIFQDRYVDKDNIKLRDVNEEGFVDGSFYDKIRVFINSDKDVDEVIKKIINLYKKVELIAWEGKIVKDIVVRVDDVRCIHLRLEIGKKVDEFCKRFIILHIVNDLCNNLSKIFTKYIFKKGVKKYSDDFDFLAKIEGGKFVSTEVFYDNVAYLEIKRDEDILKIIEEIENRYKIIEQENLKKFYSSYTQIWGGLITRNFSFNDNKVFVRVKVEKKNDENNRRYIKIKVYCNRFTSKIFRKKKKKNERNIIFNVDVLRRTESCVLVGDNNDYVSSRCIYISSDEEIEDLISEIKQLYESVSFNTLGFERKIIKKEFIIDKDVL